MQVVESWEDKKGSQYAIVRYSKTEQRIYRTMEYEAMYLLDDELHSFGGAVGYTVADFKTKGGARKFLLTGIVIEDENPEIWLEMVAVSI